MRCWLPGAASLLEQPYIMLCVIAVCFMYFVVLDVKHKDVTFGTAQGNDFFHFR